jgi:hypothetical protein
MPLDRCHKILVDKNNLFGLAIVLEREENGRAAISKILEYMQTHDRRRMSD